ncbi:hypothetical protein HMI54_014001 [Coelomomyces lativittatus]|nr:hypothetical protein HMI54_014001 [Coelomomyces lativittatus]
MENVNEHEKNEDEDEEEDWRLTDEIFRRPAEEELVVREADQHDVEELSPRVQRLIAWTIRSDR